MNLPQLTATRFFAAFAIVVFHFGVFGQHVVPFNVPWVHRVFSFSYLGVNYFFVLSGFIMAVVYYQPGRVLDRRRYWVARFARIYPLYALAGLLALIQPLLPPGDFFHAFAHTGSVRASARALYDAVAHWDFGGILLHFGLLQAWVYGYSMRVNSPGWSLSVEAFFYLSLPLLLRLSYRLSWRGLVALTLAVWVASIGLQVALIRPGDYWLHFPLTNLNVFLFGLTTGILFRKSVSGEFSETHARVWWRGLTALAGVSLALVFTVPALEPYLSVGIFNPVFAAFIGWCARSRSWVTTRLLTWSPLVVLGEVSYGVYILQMPVFLYLARVFDAGGLPADQTLRFYAGAVGLILFSTLCFYGLETPLRNFINQRLGRRPHPTPARV
jgi:peptidoglycan/LPS O-acetylase OafA/YrhL